jgi:hypothetical protein
MTTEITRTRHDISIYAHYLVSEKINKQRKGKFIPTASHEDTEGEERFTHSESRH